MSNYKSGFVSIVGRTNAGKSTLLNNLIGENIAITTSKPQTTRTTIKGIINRNNSQIIFIDTPGIHKPKSKFNESMINAAYNSINDADVILLVVEAAYEKISEENMKILEKLKDKNYKVILVVNKIDTVKKEKILKIIKMYSDIYDFASVVPISAKNNKNIDVLLNEIEKLLPEGEPYYDKDEFTDQTERQLVEEIVREKCLKLLNEEIPHGIYVKVEKMKLRKNKKGKEIYDIDIIIYCIKKSHKGIIIGKDGNMLKRIATYSRQKIEAILGIKVNMKIWVKVSEDWKNNINFTKNII